MSVAAKLAVDPQPDARYHGRRILYLLMGDSDFDKQLLKDVPGTNLRPVQDIVENLRNKVIQAVIRLKHNVSPHPP